MRVYTGEDNSNDIEIRTAYGCIVNNFSVCQGISKAFMYLCKQLGIDAYAVRSDTMSHEWNMVKLNNKYYHIDITYDAPVKNYEHVGLYQPRGYVIHKQFLKSDSQMLSLNYHNWDAEFKATDSVTFNNNYWMKAENSICIVDTFAYFIEDGNLVKIDLATNKKYNLINIQNDFWHDENNKKYHWENFTSKIAIDYQTERIYFSSSTGIFVYNIKNNSVCKIYSINTTGFIYSFVYDNNKFKLSIRDYDKNSKTVFKEQTVSNLPLPDIDFLMGDANHNGNIEISDILAIQKYLVNKTEDFNEQLADVNYDKTIDAKDSFLLKKIMLFYN